MFTAVQHQWLDVNIGDRVDVDESWRHEHACGIDDSVHGAIKGGAKMENSIIFNHEHPAIKYGVVPVLKANNPSPLNQSAHRLSVVSLPADRIIVGDMGNVAARVDGHAYPATDDHAVDR